MANYQEEEILLDQIGEAIKNNSPIEEIKSLLTRLQRRDRLEWEYRDPFHYAISHSRTDVLEVMVNELNFSVESFQLYFEFNLFRRTPLIWAIQEGNSDVAKFLLENLKANPNNCEAIFSAIDKDVER